MSMVTEADKLLEEHSQGKITRRQFVVRAGALGLSLPAISGLLAACGQASLSPTATPKTPATKNRPFEGMPIPVAATEEERTAWWLNEMRNSKMAAADLALTPEEEAKVRAMKLKVGASWSSFSSKKFFYSALTTEKRCKELGIQLITVSNEESDARRTTTAKMFINEKVDAVIGQDGHGEAVKAYNEAGIPTFSEGNPFPGFYPSTAVVGLNRYAAGEEQTRILARKLATEGHTDVTVAVLDTPPGGSWS